MNIKAVTQWAASLLVLAAIGACGGGGEADPPLEKVGAADRDWSVTDYSVVGHITPVHDSGTQIGGVVEKPYEFGVATLLDPSAPVPPLLPREFKATGRIFSSAGGGTYSVSGEAPVPVARTLDTPVGNHMSLKQHQTYIKKGDNASLRLKVTQVRLEAFDAAGANLALCTVGADDLTSALCDGPMDAYILFGVTASLGSTRTLDRSAIIFIGEGAAFLDGYHNHWNLEAPAAGQSSGVPNVATLWSGDNFTIDKDVDRDGGSRAKLALKETLTIPIDLSRVAKEGKFTLSVNATTFVRSRRHAEFAYLGAFFRDPTQIGGDVEIITEGLELTDPPPANDPGTAGGCAPGASPGGLHFFAPSFNIDEAVGGGGAQLLVARTGGSDGEVTAVVTTSNGTAAGGTDFLPVNTTVTFKHGEVAPRVVRVPLIYSGDVEPNKTFNVTLSAPTGCAGLGLATTAVTILDDGRTLPVAFSLGGTVTGLAGSGLVLTNFGIDLPITNNGAFAFALPVSNGLPYNVQVKTQPSSPSQLCTVTRGSGTIAGADVTDVAVDCTAPPPLAGLDASFGVGGKVTTPSTGTGNAVALQADGRIVTVGGAFTLTRHNPDGSLDTTFGTGGKVTTSFGSGSGTAADVAIQADGRIVVVGNARARAGFADDDNFALRRYNSDGSLDASFGTGGIVSTDFAALGDIARAVVIQADGRIVVAGQSRSATGTDLAVARYNADGTLDATFGSGGKLTTDVAGGIDFGVAMALQPDGRIVVLGQISLGGSNVVGTAGLVRYTTNGSLDTGFGVGGKVIGAANGPTSDITLQADGKIIVAGSVDAGTSNSAFGLARFFPDGSVDAAFGTPTTRFFTTGNGTIGRAVTVQADGKIVLVGEAASGASSTFDMAIARYDPNGNLDAAFGTGGKLTVDIVGGTDAALDVAIQADGKIVVAGFARNGSASEFALVRVNR